MCYSGVALVGLRDLPVLRRWQVLQANMAANNVHAPALTVEEAAGVGAGGSVKQCLCSPTQHPGSFRCRQHLSRYVWGGRVVKKERP